MASYVLHYGVQPSEFWALTRAQKEAFSITAETINRTTRR